MGKWNKMHKEKALEFNSKLPKYETLVPENNAKNLLGIFSCVQV